MKAMINGVLTDVTEPTPEQLTAGQSAAANRPAKPSSFIPGMAFMARLTDAEYGAIIAAAQTNMQLHRWLDEFRVNGGLRVSDPAVQAAKAALVAANLLTQQRADEVFA